MIKNIFLAIGLISCVVLTQAGEPKTVEECEQNIPASLKDRVCELRQYQTVDTPDMDKHMQCVLRVVGFVNAGGDVEFQELLGLLKITDPSTDHDGNIKKCVTAAAGVAASKKANTFYTCFLDTSSAAGFKNAVDYVELVRAGKLKRNAPFNAGEVADLIKQIDDGLCK